MVVADRAAGSEGIAEPEAVVNGNTVGNVREGCCALVGSNDEVGIVPVAAADILWRNDLAVDEIVGEIEETANQCRVAGDAFALEGLTLCLLYTSRCV